jgi:hypothetical protein
MKLTSDQKRSATVWIIIISTLLMGAALVIIYNQPVAPPFEFIIQSLCGWITINVIIAIGLKRDWIR